MYQILDYALKDPSNKTRFTLIFANVTEKDILLKEEFDALKAKYPKTFDVVYTVDQASADWKGPTGYINSELVTKYLPAPPLGEKAKIFVCGEWTSSMCFRARSVAEWICIGPPGQVAAVAGPKQGMKQGELGGILKQLGYTDEQVRVPQALPSSFSSHRSDRCSSSDVLTTRAFCWDAIHILALMQRSRSA